MYEVGQDTAESHSSSNKNEEVRPNIVDASSEKAPKSNKICKYISDHSRLWIKAIILLFWLTFFGFFIGMVNNIISIEICICTYIYIIII